MWSATKPIIVNKLYAEDLPLRILSENYLLDVAHNGRKDSDFQRPKAIVLELKLVCSLHNLRLLQIT
jgi:hypothetical protein